VFVVSQVDGEGYVLQDAYLKTARKLNMEDSLMTLVERLAPNCITEANERAKGKYEALQIWLYITPSIILFSANMLLHTACFNLQTTFKLAATNYTTIKVRDVII
jgi:hypothetical protein